MCFTSFFLFSLPLPFLVFLHELLSKNSIHGVVIGWYTVSNYPANSLVFNLSSVLHVPSVETHLSIAMSSRPSHIPPRYINFGVMDSTSIKFNLLSILKFNMFYSSVVVLRHLIHFNILKPVWLYRLFKSPHQYLSVPVKSASLSSSVGYVIWLVIHSTQSVSSRSFARCKFV